MKYIILSIIGLSLAGCSHIPAVQNDGDQELSEIVNGIKYELRDFSDWADANPGTTLKCNSGVQTQISPKTVTVELAKTRQKTSGATAGVAKFVVAGANGSNKNTDANTLTLRMEVPKPSKDKSLVNVTVGTEGISKTMQALMKELAEIDPQEPCLQFKTGDDGGVTLKLALTVERTVKVEGGVDFVVFSAKAESEKVGTTGNTITIDFRTN